jgi:hypothetical protein
MSLVDVRLQMYHVNQFIGDIYSDGFNLTDAEVRMVNWKEQMHSMKALTAQQAPQLTGWHVMVHMVWTDTDAHRQTSEGPSKVRSLFVVVQHICVQSP